MPKSKQQVSTVPFKRIDFDILWLGIDNLPVGLLDWSLENLQIGDSRVCLHFNERQECDGLITVIVSRSKGDSSRHRDKDVKITIIKPEDDSLLTTIDLDTIVIREKESGEIIKRYRRYLMDGVETWAVQMEVVKYTRYERRHCPAEMHWFLSEYTRELDSLMVFLKSKIHPNNESKTILGGMNITDTLFKANTRSQLAGLKTMKQHESKYRDLFLSSEKIRGYDFTAINPDSVYPVYGMFLGALSNLYEIIEEFYDPDRALEEYCKRVSKRFVDVMSILQRSSDEWDKIQSLWIYLWTADYCRNNNISTPAP